MVTLKQNRDNIPASMAEEKRWIQKTGSGKTQMPTGWNSPDSWKCLDDIPDGVPFGFAVCGHGSTYAFADFDHCIKDGRMYPQAKAVMERIKQIAPTYWEKSTSGTGLHCIVDLGDYAGNFEPIENSDGRVIVWMNPDEYRRLRPEEREKVPKVELFFATGGRYCLTTGIQDDITGHWDRVAEQEDAAAIWREYLSILDEVHEEYGYPEDRGSVKKDYSLTVDEKTKERVLDALPYISADDRPTWIQVGIALYNIGIPFDVWDEWSRYSDQRTGEACAKYNAKETPRIWKSFKGSARYTAGTIFKLAKDGGWNVGTRLAVEEPETDDRGQKTLLEVLKQLKPETAYSRDDKGNGKLFADVCKDSRWNITAGEWFYYDGKVWAEDTGGMYASRKAKQLADALLQYASSIDDFEQKQAYARHVIKLGSLNARKRMLEDAKEHRFVSSDMFDRDDYIFNCQNGVLDLHEYPFKFKPHSMEQMLSKIANVNYDPTAAGERWNRFLDEVMQGNAEKIDYLQRICGYSLTGDTREESCYLMLGQTTRNGKSTFTETAAYMMGDYALSMRPETLAQRKDNDSRRASSDIARLNGCRLVIASEPPKRMLFDVALLKTLLGRDKITARFLHQNEFQFIPRFKLFINTNSLPTVSDTTLFSSGRINVITFDRHFTPEEQDKDLKNKLKDPHEVSGILNWCLEGLRKYMKSGADAPGSVVAATEDYRISSDKIGQFFSECMVKSADHNTAAGDVYSKYATWCDENGYGIENKGNFFSDLKARNMFSATGTVNGRTLRNVVKGYIPVTSVFQKTDEVFPERGWKGYEELSATAVGYK